MHHDPTDSYENEIEELIHDGVANAGAIFKRGDKIIRPAGKHSPGVHALLHHLQERGFDGAPRAIALNDERETLSYIFGDVPKPPYDEWLLTDEVIHLIGQLQRRYHNAARDFAPKQHYDWNTDLADPKGIGPIMHNDLGPGNLVFKNHKPIGMIDFDFAAPGSYIWDLARTVRVWAPLDDPESAPKYGFAGVDPFKRLRAFCDGYSLSKMERLELCDTLEPCNTISVAYVRSKFEEGKPGFVQIWTEYNLGEMYAKRAEWMIQNRAEIRNCLT